MTKDLKYQTFLKKPRICSMKCYGKRNWEVINQISYNIQSLKTIHKNKVVNKNCILVLFRSMCELLNYEMYNHL